MRGEAMAKAVMAYQVGWSGWGWCHLRLVDVGWTKCIGCLGSGVEGKVGC